MGPVLFCHVWVDRKWKHQKSCLKSPAKTLSTAAIVTRSDIMSKRIGSVASKLVTKEVYTMMKRDEVGMLAHGDELIRRLGNMWMEKNYGYRLKRGKYTSIVMQMNASDTPTKYEED